MEKYINPRKNYKKLNSIKKLKITILIIYIYIYIYIKYIFFLNYLYLNFYL